MLFSQAEGDICGPEPAGSAQSQSVVQLPRGQFDALMLTQVFLIFTKKTILTQPSNHLLK